MTKGPKAKVKFTFSSSETGSTFKCKLDKEPFADLHLSRKTFKVKTRQAQLPGGGDRRRPATSIATPAKQKFTRYLPAVHELALAEADRVARIDRRGRG